MKDDSRILLVTSPVALSALLYLPSENRVGGVRIPVAANEPHGV